LLWHPMRFIPVRRADRDPPVTSRDRLVPRPVGDS